MGTNSRVRVFISTIAPHFDACVSYVLIAITIFLSWSLRKCIHGRFHVKVHFPVIFHSIIEKRCHIWCIFPFFSVFHYIFLQYYIYIVQFIICWIRKFVSCTGKNPTWRIFQICYDIIKREQVVSDAYYAFSEYRKRWLWFFHLIAKCFKQYSQVGDSEWWPQWQKEVNVCW